MRTQWEIENCFAPTSDLSSVRAFYLVGIGGASMSALAKMLHSRGYSVTGSDSTASAVTAELMAEGITVRIGHSGEGLKVGDALILTDAIDLGVSPEVKTARDMGLPIFRRSQLLGWFLRGKKTLAVTGTHGKTTTTGLLSTAMIEAGFDPLCINGANIPEWGGPVREGEGQIAVIEACEAYNSLRDYDPFIVLLTNLEEDHVDFYRGGFEQVLQTMLDFVNRIPEDGCLVYCEDDDGACEVAARAKCRCEPYSARFWEHGLGEPQNMRIPGPTNRLNGCGALCAAIEAGARPELAARGIERFGGAERRLQSVLEGPITVFDDYAHHPSEIRASLSALRERNPERLIVVFQPHLYSRTEQHLRGFAEELSAADLVVITDIYPAREDPIPGVSSARIAEMIGKPVTYVPSRHLLPRVVADLSRLGDLVVGMGAGNIEAFAPGFVKELQRRSSEKAGRRVAVFYGGDSAEREVSLLSGRAIADALRKKGYQVILVDLSEALLKGDNLAFLTGPDRPDVAFLAVHGTNAEDGAIQGLCELLHIPYTGSGVQASAIAMDKELTKTVLRERDIPVPGGVLLKPGEVIPCEVPIPAVVKPNAQGSTVGLSFVQERSDLANAVAKARQYGADILIEELIQGTEISVPVMGDRALPVVEIVPASGTYDFAAKYTPGATEEICPARLPEEVQKKAQELALRSHQAVGARGATRTDMIVRSDGSVVVLEVNTLPGMTGTSLLPNSAASAGINFADLCVWLVEDALLHHAPKA